MEKRSKVVISFFAVRCGRPALSTHLDMKGPRSVSSENPSPELCKITDCPGLSLVRLVSDAGCLIVDYSKDKLGIRNSKLRSFKYPRSGASMSYVECKEEEEKSIPVRELENRNGAIR